MKRTMLHRGSNDSSKKSHVNPLMAARVAAAGGSQAAATKRDKRLSAFVQPKRPSRNSNGSDASTGGGGGAHTYSTSPKRLSAPRAHTPPHQRSAVSFASPSESPSDQSENSSSEHEAVASNGRTSRRASAVPGFRGPRGSSSARRQQFASSGMHRSGGGASGAGGGARNAETSSGALDSARAVLRSTGNLLLQQSKRFMLGRTAEEEAKLLAKRNKDDAAVFKAMSTRRLRVGPAHADNSSRARSGTLALRFVESVTAVKGVLTDFALHALNAMATHERLTARRLAVSILLLLGVGSSAVFAIYLPQMALRNGEHFGLQGGFMTAYAACQLLVFHLTVVVLPYYASTGLPGPPSSTPARFIGWVCAVLVRISAFLCCAAWRSQRPGVDESSDNEQRSRRAQSSVSTASTSTVAPAIHVTTEQEFARRCCGGLCFGCAAVRAPMGHRKRSANPAGGLCWVCTPQRVFDSSGRLRQMSSVVPDPWFNASVGPLVAFALHCLNTMGFLSTMPYIPNNSFLAGLLAVHFVPFIFGHLAWLHVSWRDLFIYGQSWFGLVLSAEDDAYMLDPTEQGRDVCSAMGPCLRRTALRFAMAPRMGDLELKTVVADVVTEVDTDAAGAINAWAQYQGAAATAAAQRAYARLKVSSTADAYISAGLGALVPPPPPAAPARRATCYCCGCCKCFACVSRRCGKEEFTSDDARVAWHHDSLVRSFSELPVVSSLWRAAVKGAAAGGKVAAAHCVAMVAAGDDSALDFSEFMPDVQSMDTGVGGGVPAMSVRLRNRASTSSTVSTGVSPRHSSTASVHTARSSKHAAQHNDKSRPSHAPAAAALGGAMLHFKTPAPHASTATAGGGRRSSGVLNVLRLQHHKNKTTAASEAKMSTPQGSVTVSNPLDAITAAATPDSKATPAGRPGGVQGGSDSAQINPMHAALLAKTQSGAAAANKGRADDRPQQGGDDHAQGGGPSAAPVTQTDDDTPSEIDKYSDPSKRLRGMAQYSAAGGGSFPAFGRGRTRRASFGGGVRSKAGGGQSSPVQSRLRRASSISVFRPVGGAAEKAALVPEGDSQAAQAAPHTASAGLADLPSLPAPDLPADTPPQSKSKGGFFAASASRRSLVDSMKPTLSRARAGGGSSPRRGGGPNSALNGTKGTSSTHNKKASFASGVEDALFNDRSGTDQLGGSVHLNPLQSAFGGGSNTRASVVQRAASAHRRGQAPGITRDLSPPQGGSSGGASPVAKSPVPAAALQRLRALSPPPKGDRGGHEGPARHVIRDTTSSNKARGGRQPPPPPPRSDSDPPLQGYLSGRSGRAMSTAEARAKHGRAPPAAPVRGGVGSPNARFASPKSGTTMARSPYLAAAATPLALAASPADFSLSDLPSSPEAMRAELVRAKAAMAAMQVKLGVLARAAGIDPAALSPPHAAGGDSVTRPRRGKGNATGREDPVLTAQLAAKAEQLLQEHRKRGLNASERASVYGGQAHGGGRASRAPLGSIGTPPATAAAGGRPRSESRGRSGSAARRRTAMISYVQRGGPVQTEQEKAAEAAKQAQAEFEASLPPSMLQPVAIRVAPPPDAFASLTAGLHLRGDAGQKQQPGKASGAVTVSVGGGAGGDHDLRGGGNTAYEDAKRKAALQACIDAHGQFLHFNRFLSSLPPAQRLPLLLQGWALSQAQTSLLALLATSLTCITYLATFGLAVVGQNKHVFSFRNASVAEVTNAFWYCAISLGISIVTAIAFIPRMHIQYNILAGGQVAALLAPRPMIALSWGFLFTVAVHWLTQRSTSALMPFGEYGAGNI